MSTAPFSPDAQELLTTTHRQDYAVVAVHPDAGPIALDVGRLQVGWDETRAPRVRAALTCRVPDDQATLDLLDPRAGVRIKVDAGYVLPGGDRDVHTVADLGLRSRRVTRPQNLLELDAASDEALVIDNAPSAGDTVSAPSVPEAITSVLASVFNPAPEIVISVVDATSTAVAPVKDKWTTVQDLADRIGAQVYDDGLRTWQIAPAPQVQAVAAAALKVGAGGTILSSDTALSRETGWFNRVFLRYRWRDAAGNEQYVESVQSITGGPFATDGPAMARTYEEEREVPTSQLAADDAAYAILMRSVSRGRSLNLRARAAYWLRPGNTITVQLPTGPQERHIVTAVLFDITSGWMDVTTRLPDDTATTGE